MTTWATRPFFAPEPHNPYRYDWRSPWRASSSRAPLSPPGARMRHLILLSCLTCTVIGAEQPTDAEALTMAKRRIAANDIGLSFEQMATQARRSDQLIPA